MALSLFSNLLLGESTRSRDDDDVGETPRCAPFEVVRKVLYGRYWDE